MYLSQDITKLKSIIAPVAYIAIILFALPSNISPIHRFAFVLYASFIFWILRDHGSHIQQNANPHPWLWRGIVLGALIFFVLSRVIMFIRYGATPLGYDTGFYWQYFKQIMSYGTSVGYVGSGNIAYTGWFPYYFLGLSAISVINILHILHQFATLGAFYFLLRSFPKSIITKRFLAVGIFLFALSINQFMAFWWMFYKQSMALPFLLLASGLFLRRSWLAIPVAAFGAAIHLQSAVPFGIAFSIFFLYQIGARIIKKQPLDRELLYIGLSGIVAGLLIVILKGRQDLLSYFEYFKQYGGLTSNARDWEIQQTKGLFISFAAFRLNTLFYLPFALTGILTMRSWFFDKAARARQSFIPILLFVSFILASFPFLYQNRTLIILDLLLILFATYPLTMFVKKLITDKSGRVILGLLLIGSVFLTSRIIWSQPPQIYAEEIREIKVITQLRKPGDYAMALTSLYTPWVNAYTNFQETIAPGWLSWNKWDLRMWQEFWNGESNTRRLELLSIYGDHDIYMFAGKYFIPSENLKKFFENDPHIVKISPHVWKYSPVFNSSATVQ